MIVGDGGAGRSSPGNMISPAESFDLPLSSPNDALYCTVSFRCDEDRLIRVSPGPCLPRGPPPPPGSLSSAEDAEPWDDAGKRTRPVFFPDAVRSGRRTLARAGDGDVARKSMSSAASASMAGLGVVPRPEIRGDGESALLPMLSLDEDTGARESDSDSNEEVWDRVGEWGPEAPLPLLVLLLCRSEVRAAAAVMSSSSVVPSRISMSVVRVDRELVIERELGLSVRGFFLRAPERGVGDETRGVVDVEALGEALAGRACRARLFVGAMEPSSGAGVFPRRVE